LNNIKPLVSICIPAFNAEKTIGRTLDSILNQNYDNVEIILSDNHSTDKTASIVKLYEKRNVNYFLNPTKSEDLINTSSVVSNFNYVISLAKGEFIAIYHADDVYDPTIIEQQVLFLQMNEFVGSVFTSSHLIDENDNILKIKVGEIPVELKSNNIIDYYTLLNSIILSENHLMFPTLMIRTEALKYVGNFNPKESYVSDIEYYLRLARWKSIGFIDKKLHYYRSNVNQKNNILQNKFHIIKHYIRFIEDYIKLPDIQASINISNIKYYEMLICSRKIFLTRHYFYNNKNNIARELLKSFKYEYILLSFKRQKCIQSMFLGLFFRIADKFGIASILAKSVEKMSHFRYNLWQKKLY